MKQLHAIIMIGVNVNGLWCMVLLIWAPVLIYYVTADIMGGAGQIV